MTCSDSGSFSGLTVCTTNTILMAGMIIAFVATTSWIARAQWIPALVSSRNVLGLAKTIAAAIGCFSAIWLSVTRLIMSQSRSLFDISFCLVVTMTFATAFTATFLSKTASSATPKTVCVAWWVLVCTALPRVTIRAEEEGTTEDNCIRTMLVAAGCLAFAYLIPKTDIPRDFEHSVLASPILAKLCVDVLRISSEAFLIARMLDSIEWDWFAVFSPAIVLDGACLLWLLQKYWSAHSPQQRLAWSSAETGVLMWSVIGGAPWGLISMLMWAFSADVWDFQLRNGTSKFPCRFVMPYALLPICAGVAAARAVHKRILATYNKHDVAVFVAAAAFPVVVFIAGLPILTLVLKTEYNDMSWAGACVPLILALFVLLAYAVWCWVCGLRLRESSGSDVFKISSEHRALLSSQGIHIPLIHRPTLGISHWLSFGDVLHMASLVATAITVVDAVQRNHAVTWQHFVGLGVGEVLNLSFTLFVLLRTECIPYLRMLWHVRRAAMEVDDFILSVQLDQMEEFIPSAAETSPLLAFAAMTARRGQPTDDGSLNGGDHVVIDTQDSFRSFGGKSSELKDAAEDAGEGCDEGGDVATSLPAFRSKASSSGYSITLADVEAAKCVVCLTNPREVLLRPCKHVVMCKDCASTRNRAGVPRVQQCPICRSPILNRERIFM